MVCLAVPVQVVELDNEGLADVLIGSVKKKVNVELIEDLNVGDYVLVHAGFALSRLDHDEAMKTLALFEEIIS